MSKIKGWKNKSQANTHQKKAEVFIIITDKRNVQQVIKKIQL